MFDSVRWCSVLFGQLVVRVAVVGWLAAVERGGGGGELLGVGAEDAAALPGERGGVLMF